MGKEAFKKSGAANLRRFAPIGKMEILRGFRAFAIFVCLVHFSVVPSEATNLSSTRFSILSRIECFAKNFPCLAPFSPLKHTHFKRRNLNL